MLKIVFAGTPSFAATILEAFTKVHPVIAVYTKADKPSGRGQKLTASPVKSWALAHGLKVYQPLSLRNVAVQTELRELQPDLWIDVAYGLFLPPEVLKLPHLGCINVHPSLLPRWRGAAPIPRALLAGDKETGVTIMQMDEGLDTGAIYLQKSFPIENNATSTTLFDKAATIGADLLIEVVERLAKGTITACPQGKTPTPYAEKLSKEEGKIIWCEDAERIMRKIRAFNPWPVAYSEISGQIVRIWEAEICNHRSSKPAGTILQLSQSGIVVATGNGAIIIKMLQFPGKKPQRIKDLLNGCGKWLKTGMYFN